MRIFLVFPLPQIKILAVAESQINSATSSGTRLKWISFSCYADLSYVISLRGNEGFLLDLGGLHRHYSSATEDYFIVALLGKFKGEANDNAHLIPCANRTSSGIEIRNIVFQLLKEKKIRGSVTGPAISDEKGAVLKSHHINSLLMDVLETIASEDSSLFPPDVKTEFSESEDSRAVLSQYYACFRSFRRASDSRALNRKNKLDSDDIEIVNRWRTVELAKGKRPQCGMKQHYADIQVLIEPFLRYTRAM